MPDRLVDPETGEMYEAGEGERFVKEKRVEDPYCTAREEGFMKVYLDAAKKMARELTGTEMAMVIGLMPYVSYTDCCIRVGGVGEVMDIDDIANALEMDKKKVYRLISSLEKKGVMGHHVTGSILKGYEGKVRKVYTVNPFIYCKGKRVNKAVYDFYEHSGWGGV